MENLMGEEPREDVELAMDHEEAHVKVLARALNAARVPCVLWGHALLSVYGCRHGDVGNVSSPAQPSPKPVDPKSSSPVLVAPGRGISPCWAHITRWAR